MMACMICHGEDNMLDYSLIFEPKQHYITIPQIPSKKMFVNQRQLNRILKNQEDDWDIYITKYPKTHCVSTIILDFDDKENPDNALKESMKLKNYLKRKGLNTVIVSSGKKGNHVYIQIPCHNFVGGELSHVDADPNVFFKEYIKNLIGLYDGLSYQTLDEINFSAGLKGNIRLINSQHPKGDKCKIIEGEFIESVEPNSWDWDCFLVSKSHAEDKVTEFKKANNIDITGNDLIAENDLQDIFEEVFGVTMKRYNGYSYCCCPFHNDEHPSMFVDKEKFSCNGCGKRGNLWTLIKEGYVKLDNDIRVRRD